jgi:hypothetical protein
MRSTAFLFLASLTLGACAADSIDTDELVASGDDGKADTATELSLRAGETTVWVQQVLARKGDAWVLHGRTSRNLQGGNAYVFDDVFGDFSQPSVRTFEVSYGTTSSGPLLVGSNLFVGLDAPTAGVPLTLRAVVRPRVLTSSGSSKIYFTAEITPVVMDGITVYRLEGKTTVAATAVSATAGTARMIDGTHFQIDMTMAEVAALAGAAGTLDVTTQIATGPVTRKAHVGLSIKKLGLTTGDAYDQWPVPTCTSKTKSCLTALASDALDTASCGDAITTLACEGQVGAMVDTTAVNGALDAISTRTADPAFQSDSAALVGADHAAAFRETVATRATTAVDALGGRWYLSAATRDARLAAASTGTFDAAYARPLQFVAPHTPAPGDAALSWQVAADALLAYLATQDYLHSEFERTLDQLTTEFRAQHVQSLNEFRTHTNIEDFTDASLPHSVIYIGQWLGTHTEITIDTDTGAATNVLVELD